MKPDLAARAVLAALLAAYAVAFFPHYSPLPEATSAALQPVLGVAGIESASLGRYLMVQFPSGGRVLELSAECSGVAVFAMFALAAILLPDIPLRHRLSGIALIPLLMAGNFVRILSGIAFAWVTTPEYLPAFHDTAGQVLFFVWAILVWLAWLKFSGRLESERATYRAELDF